MEYRDLELSAGRFDLCVCKHAFTLSVSNSRGHLLTMRHRQNGKIEYARDMQAIGKPKMLEHRSGQQMLLLHGLIQEYALKSLLWNRHSIERQGNRALLVEGFPELVRESMEHWIDQQERR